MKQFNYVYISTNLVTGKQYVGDHSTDDLGDGYVGSGVRFNASVNKHGKENFKKEILEWFDTKQDAFDAQEKWINEYNTLYPNGYNLSPKGGHNVGGCFSDETLEKLRKGSQYVKTPEHIKKISDGVKRYIGIHGQTKSFLGKQHSTESKKKMSKSHTGKKMSEASKLKNRNAHLSENLSDEVRKNMSNGAKRRWENYRKNKH